MICYLGLLYIFVIRCTKHALIRICVIYVSKNKTIVYGVETTVYVHLTEERGYYLPFQSGEPATVSETNTTAGAIFIAVATWIAQFIARCRRRSIGSDGRAPSISARVICAHGDLSSPSARATARSGRRPFGRRLNNNIDRRLVCCGRTEPRRVAATRPAQTRRSFIFIWWSQLDGSSAAAGRSLSTWREYDAVVSLSTL